MKTPYSWMILILSGLMSVTGPVSSAQETREWTTIDGKKHQGSLMFMSSKSVTIKGSRGMVSLSLTKLSEADRKYINQLKSNTKTVSNPGIPIANVPPGMVRKSTPPVPATPTPSQPTPTPTPTVPRKYIPGQWPAEIKTDFSPAQIQTVSETKREGYVYRSPHFEFRSPIRLPHRAVREFSLVFESTYDFLSAMPIGLDPKPGGNGFYRTQLHNDLVDYEAAGGPPGSAGAYFPHSSTIHVPLTSLGVIRTQNNIRVQRGASENTLIHEVTHQVMRRWLPLIPMWMGEGFAEITSAMPYEAGRFRLARMTTAVRKSTGRGPGAGRSFEMVPLFDLMNISPQAWGAAVASGEGEQNYRSACVLTYYFLRLDGEGKGERLIAYVNARLQEGNLGDAKSAEQKYLLDGRSYDQLQKEVARAWREEGLKLTFRN